jgi:hypothetical protein
VRLLGGCGIAREHNDIYCGLEGAKVMQHPTEDRLITAIAVAIVASDQDPIRHGIPKEAEGRSLDSLVRAL